MRISAEALVMGVVTVIAVFVMLALIDGINAATYLSAIVAGIVSFAVTTYQVGRRR